MRSIAALTLFAASLLLGLHGTAAASPSPSMPHQSSCVTAIVLFSPCIAYVGDDMEANVTPLCCSSYSSVLASGSGVCLCYLLWERAPPILGLPLNETRLFSLSSDCSSINATIANRGSLQTLCSASPPLPLISGGSGSPLPAAPGSGPASASSLSPDASPEISNPELSDSSPDESPELSDDYETPPNYAPEPNESDRSIDDYYPESSSVTPQMNAIGTTRLSAGSAYMILLVTYGLLQWKM